MLVDLWWTSGESVGREVSMGYVMPSRLAVEKERTRVMSFFSQGE